MAFIGMCRPICTRLQHHLNEFGTLKPGSHGVHFVRLNPIDRLACIHLTYNDIIHLKRPQSFRCINLSLKQICFFSAIKLSELIWFLR